MRLFESPSEFLSFLVQFRLASPDLNKFQLVTAPTSRSRAILPTLVGYFLFSNMKFLLNCNLGRVLCFWFEICHLRFSAPYRKLPT